MDSETLTVVEVMILFLLLLSPFHHPAHVGGWESRRVGNFCLTKNNMKGNHLDTVIYWIPLEPRCETSINKFPSNEDAMKLSVS